MSGGQSGGPLGGKYAPGNRFQRRHAQDSQGKWHNMVHVQRFGDWYTEWMRPTRQAQKAGRLAFRDEQRAKRAAARWLATSPNSPFSRILPVPNEAHPLFQENPGTPRTFEYTVCG